jgi:Tfp pilus assembly protein PilF
MKKYIYISVFLIILFPCYLFPGEMILHENEKYLKIFYTQSDNSGWNAELKGMIISTGADYGINNDFDEEGIKKNLIEDVEGKTGVFVRLYNRLGINIGDILYVVNGSNLIIAKIKVVSIFESRSFGYLLTGSGEFGLTNSGDRVVQRSQDIARGAYLNNARADYYKENNRAGEAIEYYKKTLDKDKGNPEAHISLANIYLESNMNQLAMREFKEAEKNSARLYDNEDKFLLYKGMCQVRFNEAYYTSIPDNLRNNYIKEGMEYSLKALEIFPDSREVNFYLGVFYYKNINPSDEKARNQFLKVIGIDSENADAFIALAELYEKHNNKDRALSYAEQALKVDPANDRAKLIYNRLK